MVYIGAVGFLGSVLGFGLGGVMASLLKNLQQKVSTINALCTGVLLGLVYFEIAPESLYLGGWKILVIGSLLGTISFLVIHEFTHKIIPSTNNLQKDRFIQTGFLLAISITIHNLPLGIAFGSSYHLELSKSLLQTLVVHNIPEGIAMFIPLFLAGLKFKHFLFIISFISLPVGVGAILGSIIGMKFPVILAFIISIALGIIIIVTIKEIFVAAVRHSSILYACAIAGLGWSIIWVYLFIT
ncbi:ZIP family metal transporter [Rummeliibacillus sp. JY-2-4R]